MNKTKFKDYLDLSINERVCVKSHIDTTVYGFYELYPICQLNTVVFDILRDFPSRDLTLANFIHS